MDSSNLHAVQSQEATAAFARAKKKLKSDKAAQGSSMGAASGSAPSTKGRKKRSSRALDENDAEGGSENGEATTSKSKRAKTVKDSAKVDLEDQFFEVLHFLLSTFIETRPYIVLTFDG